MKCMESKIRFVLIVTLLCHFVTMKGQHTISEKYTYKRYALADGLPQMQVTHLTQDHKGYLWVSHWNGLSRFDGFNFDNFTQKQGLADVATFHTIEYFPDSMAVLSFKGISIGGIEGFKAYSFPEGIKGDRNAYMYVIGDSLLITNLITYSSENRRHFYFDLKNHTFSELKSLCNIFIREINVLTKSFYVYTDKQYFEFEKSNKTLLKKKDWRNQYDDFAVSPSGQYFAYCREAKSLYEIEIIAGKANEAATEFKIGRLSTTFRLNRFAITEDNKVVWFDNNYELYLTDRLKTETVGKKFGIVRNFFNDREGNLWIATEEGLYNYFQFQFQSIKILPDDFSDMIWSIAETETGSMLYGSCNRGLYNVYNHKVNKINLLPYKFPYERKDDVDKAYMGATKLNNGEVLIPFSNSLVRYSKGRES